MTDLHSDEFGKWKKFTLTTSPQTIAAAIPGRNIYYGIVAGNATAGQIIINNGEADYAPIYVGSGYDSVKVFSSKAGLAPTIRSDVTGLEVNIIVFNSARDVTYAR